MRAVCLSVYHSPPQAQKIQSTPGACSPPPIFPWRGVSVRGPKERAPSPGAFTTAPWSKPSGTLRALGVARATRSGREYHRVEPWNFEGALATL